MYARIKNDVVVSYPVDINALHPNVIFPPNWEGGAVEGGQYAKVRPVAPPVVPHTKNLTEGKPTKSGDAWTQVWVVTDASPAEVEERLAAKWAEVRGQRNALLATCDWTQLPDSPLATAEKGKWKTYRKALRDITEQYNPFNIVWPLPPEA